MEPSTPAAVLHRKGLPCAPLPCPVERSPSSRATIPYHIPRRWTPSLRACVPGRRQSEGARSGASTGHWSWTDAGCGYLRGEDALRDSCLTCVKQCCPLSCLRRLGTCSPEQRRGRETFCSMARQHPAGRSWCALGSRDGGRLCLKGAWVFECCPGKFILFFWAFFMPFGASLGLSQSLRFTYGSVGRYRSKLIS